MLIRNGAQAVLQRGEAHTHGNMLAQPLPSPVASGSQRHRSTKRSENRVRLSARSRSPYQALITEMNFLVLQLHFAFAISTSSGELQHALKICRAFSNNSLCTSSTACETRVCFRHPELPSIHLCNAPTVTITPLTSPVINNCQHPLHYHVTSTHVWATQ